MNDRKHIRATSRQMKLLKAYKKRSMDEVIPKAIRTDQWMSFSNKKLRRVESTSEEI